MTPAVPSGSGTGRQPKRLRRGGDDAPVEQIGALAKGLPAGAWQEVTWREGGAGQALASRFSALRVRPAQGDHRRSQPRPEQWLLAEWPEDEAEPTKFWFSNLPAETPLKRLVYLAKLRWLIERDYQELKQELGLGHYEGRGWPGFHHHAALCIAAYGFLVAERAAIPPSAAQTDRLVQAPQLPADHKPRGSAAANRAPCVLLHRHTATTDRPQPGEKPPAMSLLRSAHQIARQFT
jgi:SRSO17 transposase